MLFAILKCSQLFFNLDFILLAVKWSNDSSSKTYSPITGKLLHKSKESRFGDSSRQRQRKPLPVALYSSLEGTFAIETRVAGVFRISNYVVVKLFQIFPLSQAFTNNFG